MSYTPRTDEEACRPACDDSSDKYYPGGEYVAVEFARQLERETQSLLAALRGLLSVTPASAPAAGEIVGIEAKHAAAIAAARAAIAKAEGK